MQLAMHGVGQAFAQGQPKTGATEAPRNLRVGLGERREDVPQCLLGNANAGVADLDADTAQVAIALVELQAQGDVTVLGELERVGQQVTDNLSYPRRIAQQ